jgi:hypothetical protein
MTAPMDVKALLALVAARDAAKAALDAIFNSDEVGCAGTIHAAIRAHDDACEAESEAAAAFIRSPEFAALVADGERLNWLDRFVATEGGLILHNGTCGTNFAGLGLINGRSLRDALDAARSGKGEGNG